MDVLFVLTLVSTTQAVVLPKLWVSDTSVSGLSSGAFMAAQYEVIFSSEVTGAGIVAGGMYYCTEGSRLRVPVCGVTPGLLSLDDDVSDLVKQARKFSDAGKIDNLDNVKSHKIFLFSGKKDSTIDQEVVKQTRKTYLGYGVPAENIVSEFSLDAPHAWPTLDYGGSCNSRLSGPPFMAKCGRDFPGEILMHTLPNLPNPTRGTQKAANLLSFRQSDFSLSGTDMADTGYVYLPDGCREGTQTEVCRIHVAFHGCAMSYDSPTIDKAFVKNSGLNQWAEANNIVVLYPQMDFGLNLGCWDYIGSTGSNFHTKSGKQVAAVNRMVKHLKSGQMPVQTMAPTPSPPDQTMAPTPSPPDQTMAPTPSPLGVVTPAPPGVPVPPIAGATSGSPVTEHFVASATHIIVSPMLLAIIMHALF